MKVCGAGAIAITIVLEIFLQGEWLSFFLKHRQLGSVGQGDHSGIKCVPLGDEHEVVVCICQTCAPQLEFGTGLFGELRVCDGEIMEGLEPSL